MGHFTLEQRYTIQVLREEKLSQQAIAYQESVIETLQMCNSSHLNPDRVQGIVAMLRAFFVVPVPLRSSRGIPPPKELFWVTKIGGERGRNKLLPKRRGRLRKYTLPLSSCAIYWVLSI